MNIVTYVRSMIKKLIIIIIAHKMSLVLIFIIYFVAILIVDLSRVKYV